MPTPNHKHWKLVKARDRAIRDLVRLQHAPVKDGEATRLHHDIKAEVAKFGLPDSDADWFYHKMQRDAWRFCGIPITDWRATIENWHGHQFFPSQR